MSSRDARLRLSLASFAVLALGACGGGGGSGGGAPSNEPGSGWVMGQFQPSETYAHFCARPRTGTDPTTGEAYADQQGRTLDENNWLRSWSNELYLWYDEIVDRNPATFSNPRDYFAVLKTTATTPSGNAKDRFHFTYATDEWLALSEAGVAAGYGATFEVLESFPPREIVVAYTQPGSPATDSGLERGARILSVDGVDAVLAGDQASVDVLNSGLFPSDVGELHTFEVRDLGAATSREVQMISEEVTLAPVQSVGIKSTPMGARVGYLEFNDHIATAEQALVDAVSQLAVEGIEDLVLDIRYNGGGYLYIASELAYMIAGDVPTAGQVFEQIEFNDKYPTTNPVTGAAIQPVPFYNAYQPFPGAPIQRLPALDLPRVFVLTGTGTCSASESIINSLRGVGVEVIQIGSPTCGKPYGFYPEDNCGTTYFSIQYRGVNAAGFGDYTEGFKPSGDNTGSADVVPGCAVDDDFDHALGDPDEARLAAALQFRDASACPLPLHSATSGLSSLNVASPATDTPIAVSKPPWRMNRILRD